MSIAPVYPYHRLSFVDDLIKELYETQGYFSDIVYPYIAAYLRKPKTSQTIIIYGRYEGSRTSHF